MNAKPSVAGSHCNCAKCGERDYCMPLHGEKGGPPFCLLCLGKWHGEHGRRRRLGRIVIRAIAAFLDGGGRLADIENLKFSALGLDFNCLDDFLDPLGYLADTASTAGETIVLTSELLADTLRLTHPDHHPTERQELAHRVTQELLELKPFVFPKPAPKPKPQPQDVTARRRSNERPDSKPLRYPCSECASTIPFYYCKPCRGEFEKRLQVERDKESAKRRASRARRKAASWKSKACGACGKEFGISGGPGKGKRKDARFCSDACRQKAHRKTVTDNKPSTRGPTLIRDAAADREVRP
jgi:hypothetical protein